MALIVVCAAALAGIAVTEVTRPLAIAPLLLTALLSAIAVPLVWRQCVWRSLAMVACAMSLGAARGSIADVSISPLGLAPPGTGLVAALAPMREAARTGILRYLPEPQASLAAGVLLGGSGHLDPAFRGDLQRSGLGHLVAVDGFKQVIVAATVGALTRRIFGAKLAVLPTLVAIGGYTLLSGAHPSAVRAGLMVGLAQVAALGGRLADPLTSLGVATLGMALLDPYVLLDVGLQLSVSATLGIVLLWPVLRRLRRLRVLPKSIREPLGLTLAVTLGCLPVTLSTFEVVSLVSPVAHLVAVPLLPVVLVSAAVLALASNLPPSASLARPSALPIPSSVNPVLLAALQAPSSLPLPATVRLLLSLLPPMSVSLSSAVPDALSLLLPQTLPLPLTAVLQSAQLLPAVLRLSASPSPPFGLPLPFSVLLVAALPLSPLSLLLPAALPPPLTAALPLAQLLPDALRLSASLSPPFDAPLPFSVLLVAAPPLSPLSLLLPAALPPPLTAALPLTQLLPDALRLSASLLPPFELPLPFGVPLVAALPSSPLSLLLPAALPPPSSLPPPPAMPAPSSLLPMALLLPSSVRLAPLASVAAWLAWLPASLLSATIHVFGSLPGAAVSTGRLPPLGALLLAGVLLGCGVWHLPELAAPRRTFARWWTGRPTLLTHASTVGACLGALTLLSLMRPDGRVSVARLAAGRGDAIFVRAPTGRTILIVQGSADGRALADGVAGQLAVWEHKLDQVVVVDAGAERAVGTTLARYPTDQLTLAGPTFQLDLGAGQALTVESSRERLAVSVVAVAAVGPMSGPTTSAARPGSAD